MARLAPTIILVLLGAVVSGCAFEDGKPWGQATVALGVDFDDRDRLEDGRLRTNLDYGVVVDRLVLSIDSVALTMTSGGGGGETFDPANPPEGYSLCHNGHCHADTGELVDYEDIQIEISGGDFSAVHSVEDNEVQLPVAAGSSVNVRLGECTDECRLQRGSLATVDATVSRVAVEGRVFDRRTGDRVRLPDEGIAFRGVLTESVTLQTPISGTIGRGEKPNVRIDSRLVVGGGMLDDLDFAVLGSDPAVTYQLGDDPALGGQISDNLGEHFTIDANVSQSE